VQAMTRLTRALYVFVLAVVILVSLVFTITA
jgi:hypothetical protein